MERIQFKNQQITKDWTVRIKVTREEEKQIKKKILDSDMNIGEYIKSKILD